MLENDKIVPIGKLQKEMLEIIRATTSLERNAIWRVIAGQELELNENDEAEVSKEGMVIKSNANTFKRPFKNCLSCINWEKGSCKLIPIREKECRENSWKYYEEKEK